jgi:hypothetical protein
MPAQSTLTQIHLDNIITGLNAALATVEVISTELKTPFLEPIVTTMWSLLSAGQVSAGHLGLMETNQLRLDG